MSDTQRPRARRIPVDYALGGLVLWSLTTAAGALVTADSIWARALLVLWVALGAWLLWSRWRPRRSPW